MSAIIWPTKYFRTDLLRERLKIRTDHKPLKWLMNFKEPISKLVRWKLQLNEYDYEVEYIKGSQNLEADALGRVNLKINTHSVDLGKEGSPKIEYNIKIIILTSLFLKNRHENLFRTKLHHRKAFKNT